MLLALLIKGFDQMAPGPCAVIDPAEIQYLALEQLAAGTTLMLDDIPVVMLFAVFEASVGWQEHVAKQPTTTARAEEVTWSTRQANTSTSTRTFAPDLRTGQH